MAWLQILKGPKAGQLIELAKDKNVIGRHPDCEIMLDANAVSRQHAQVLHAGEQFEVEDLNSRNGTFVNGDKVQGRRVLQDNDRLKICDFLLTFHLQQPQKSDLNATLAPEQGTMFVDEPASGSSTVMSKVDVAGSRSGLHLRVNPEAKLRAILEITRNLGTALSLDDVLPKILDSLFAIFPQADRGFIALKHPATGQLIPKAVKHRRGDDETIRISRTIVQQVLGTKEAILSADAASDSRFDAAQSIADYRIRSMMCAPLIDSGSTPLGVIQLDTLDQRARFQPDDLEVLANVASQASFAVENAQLHDEAIKKQALERDLQLARQVQLGFLPGDSPSVDGYSFFNFYLPANQVGGDYFDYVPLKDGRLGIVLADVAGKGMPAALLVAKLSADTRYALASCATPAEAISQMNDNFCRTGPEGRFVTMVLAVLDPLRHEVTFVNAGHMAPFLTTPAGEVLPKGEAEAGVPLGVMEGYPYEQFSLQLQPGDSLTLFTDGISEAMDVQNELYGMERLQRQLQTKFPTTAELGAHVLADVKKFVGERAQSDDICLVCFGRQA